MPTNRTRRRRTRTQPDAIAALESGAPMVYSPEAWNILIGAYYFGDHPDLSPAAMYRCRDLLDEWLELQLSHERAGRPSRGH